MALSIVNLCYNDSNGIVAVTGWIDGSCWRGEAESGSSDHVASQKKDGHGMPCPYGKKAGGVIECGGSLGGRGDDGEADVFEFGGGGSGGDGY